MKVGISTATFFTKVLTEDSFSVIQRCGGDTAEVFLTTFFEYEKEFGNLLKERKGSLEIHSIHSLNTHFEPQLFNVAPRTYQDAENIYRKVLEVGKIIGAKEYTFHGQARLKKDMRLNPEFTGKRFDKLCSIASEYGIKLCLENVHWATFSYPQFFGEIKPYAPTLGTVLDIKQARLSGYDWRDYLAAMGDTLQNVHVSDVKDGNITMVGKGEFPFKELAARLKDVGYDGPITIEQYAGNYDSIDEVKESVEYLKNILEA